MEKTSNELFGDLIDRLILNHAAVFMGESDHLDHISAKYADSFSITLKFIPDTPPFKEFPCHCITVIPNFIPDMPKSSIGVVTFRGGYWYHCHKPIAETVTLTLDKLSQRINTYRALVQQIRNGVHQEKIFTFGNRAILTTFGSSNPSMIDKDRRFPITQSVDIARLLAVYIISKDHMIPIMLGNSFQENVHKVLDCMWCDFWESILPPAEYLANYTDIG